jgi:hypothetical protein
MIGLPKDSADREIRLEIHELACLLASLTKCMFFKEFRHEVFHITNAYVAPYN